MYFPSFSEYCTEENKTPENAWREYIITGGLPIVAKMQDREEKMSYLKNLCDETYLKDIIARNNIRKPDVLSELFDVLASLDACPCSTSKITATYNAGKDKEITDDTVKKYIGYFENAFILSKARKYSIKGRKYINSPFKIYFEDPGVRNARLNFRQIEETHLMENIIYNELLYRGWNVDTGELTVSVETDRKDKNNKKIYEPKNLEVDFIANKGDQKLYIQSALSLSSDKKSTASTGLSAI